MEEKATLKSFLRVKYSYGPYFWIGVCLLALYYNLQVNRELWDLVAISGACLMLFDRIMCRFKRLKIYEHAEYVDPAFSEKIELDISIPNKFVFFDRQRGIIFGCAIVGFYSGYVFWFYMMGMPDVFHFSAFYFWGVGATLLLYQSEARDIYRWKKIARRSKGQELMMSNRAAYISARVIKFTGHVADLKKKFVLTSSGHLMILWQDVESWMLVRRAIMFLGPSIYFHEIRFRDGRIIRIDREHLLEHENNVLHHARRHTQVIVEER